MYEGSQPLVHPLWVWDGWLVVFWCTILVLEPKEKLKLFNISITKLHWRIYEIKMILIAITLVKLWWATRDGRRQTKWYTMWMFVHLTHLMLSSATLSNEIIYCSSLIEYLVVCVPSTTATWISFCNHKNRKVVWGKRNGLVLYVDDTSPNPSGVVLWNPFIWNILYSFLIKNGMVQNT